MSNENQFDPVESLSSLRDNLRKAVDAGVRSVTHAMYPPLDIYQVDNEVIVQTAPLDGLDATSIDVAMVGSELTISGLTRNPRDLPTESYLRRERDYGQFTRTLSIPVRVEAEAAKATVKNGVLTIRFPVETLSDDDVINVQVANS